MKKEIKKKKKLKKEELSKKEKINNFIKLICNAIGLAMGIAVIVLYILKKLDTNDAIIMLGVGVFAVSLPAIMKTKY